MRDAAFEGSTGDEHDAVEAFIEEVVGAWSDPSAFAEVPFPAQPEADKLDVTDRLKEVIELLRAAVEDRQVGGRLVHTAVEAGKLLGIDKERIAGWASAQKIRAWRDGSRWRIPHEEVERLGREGFPRDPGKRGRPRKMPSASSVADEIRALRTRRR